MGQHGDPDEIKAHIEVATGLREKERTIEGIADDLGITPSKARNYSRGYPSSGAYTKELERQTELFCELLRIRLRDMRTIGDEISRIKPGKSVVIEFLKTHLPVRERKKRIEDAFYSGLKLLGLVELTEDTYLHYRNGKYSLRAKSLRGRAYINAYAKVVLERERVEVGEPE